MRFKNQLPGGPSLHGFAIGRAEETIVPILPGAKTGIARLGQSLASGPRLRLHLEMAYQPGANDWIANCDDGIRTSSERDPCRSQIQAKRFRAVMKAIGGFAVRGEAVFESVLLAAMSWTIAQALAGCAEYCQAIHPTLVEPGGAVDQQDAAEGAQSEPSVASQPGSRRIGAREIGPRPPQAIVMLRTLEHRTSRSVEISCPQTECGARPEEPNPAQSNLAQPRYGGHCE